MSRFLSCFIKCLMALGVASALAGPLAVVPFSLAAGVTPPAPWRVVGLPHSAKALTRFDVVVLDEQKVLRIRADSSYANLVHELRPAVPHQSTWVRWSWRLDQPLLDANLRQREGDDSPLKLCLLFDEPPEAMAYLDRSLLGLERAASAEPLPGATLCYLWDHSLPEGTLLNNAFTSRIRSIVLNTGEQRLGEWVSHQRDVAADFRRAFGKESPDVPALLGVLVGADADNTKGHSLAHVTDIRLGP